MKPKKLNIARAIALGLPPGAAPSPVAAVPSQEQMMGYLLDFVTQATVLLVGAESESDDEDLTRAVNHLMLHPGFNIVGGVLVDMMKQAKSPEDARHTKQVLAAMASRKEAAKRAAT